MILGDIVRMNGGRFAQKIALIDENSRHTFREINSRVNRIIHALHQKGIIKGDRIALLLYNCNTYPELYFAASKAGFVLVPLNYRLVPNELKYILNDAEPKAFIFGEAFLEKANSIKKDLDFIREFMVVGNKTPQQGFINFTKMTEGFPDHEPACQSSEDDIVFIMYTSGTTGQPKGAMITQKNLMSAVINQLIEVSPAPKDVLFSLPPFYHIAALATFLVHFCRGCTHMTISRFDPAKVLEWIDRENPTSIHLVPAMQNMLLNFPNIEKANLSGIHSIFYGASPMMKAQLKESIKLFQCKFFQFAGLTEITGHLSCLRPEDHLLEGPPEKVKRLGSAGREGMGLETRIVDLKGNECPPGVPGEQIVRGDSVMAGYWKMPEETCKTIKDGWLYTGDICIKDDEGYIYYVDRYKDMIIRGGENVYPREVEEVISTHPGVMEVAVIGVPDDRLGESVKAVVVARPGHSVSEDDILILCNENLASFKRPGSIEFLEELPKNPTGKVLKRVLRELF